MTGDFVDADIAELAEVLAEGTPDPQAERRAAAALLGALGLTAAAVPPPPDLRARVLAAARAVRPDPLVIRRAERDWLPTRTPGVSARILAHDPLEGRYTVVARLAPGAAYPTHVHADTEELYILEGDLLVQGQPLGPGDFCGAPRGTSHREAGTRAGCTFLVSSSERDELGRDLGTPPEALVFARASSPAWTSEPDGTARRALFRDRERGTATAVLRLPAGARLPVPTGDGVQQLYLLEGAARLGGEPLAPGDYCRMTDASARPLVADEAGCTVLTLASHL
jgi:quercetin dioxygenase-like cupin family protein